MKLLFEASRELPLVQLVVTFRVGGAHDPVGLEGLSRITARMLRRGSRSMTGEQLEERADALGAELAAHVGLGSTSVGLETVSRSLDEAAALAAEFVAEPTFDEVELEKLKRQVEAEIIASRDEDESLASRALRRNLFRGHPHGRRVQGSVSSVRAITRDDVVAHYARSFAAENAIVAVGGDVDEKQAEALARLLLERLPSGTRLEYPVEEPLACAGRRLALVEKPERSQCQLGIGILGAKLTDDDYVPLVLANAVFGGMFTSRLNQEVRVKRGWSYGANSGLATSLVREAFTIWAAPSVDDAVDCLELELGLLEAFCANGIDSAELGFARDYYRRSYAFEIDTGKKRLQQKLDRELLGLPDDFHTKMLERMGSVTASEASKAVRNRLDPHALWVAAVVAPEDVGEDLAEALDWDEVCVEPFDRD